MSLAHCCGHGVERDEQRDTLRDDIAEHAPQTCFELLARLPMNVEVKSLEARIARMREDDRENLEVEGSQVGGGNEERELLQARGSEFGE